MWTASDLDVKVCDEVARFDLNPIWDHFEYVSGGQQGEVKDITGKPNRYYQWLACLCKVTKPKQIIELGAAAGISTIMLALHAPDAQIYSVDNDPQAWRWMKYPYNNVKKILHDDLDMSIWDGVDLSQTDICFIDTLHEENQLRKEVELYLPKFKKGTIVVFDDIHLHEGMDRVWNDLPYDKCDTTNPNHYSGFGHIII